MHHECSNLGLPDSYGEQRVRTEKVYPGGVLQEDCWLSHTRPVWRLEMLVATAHQALDEIERNVHDYGSNQA